MQFSAVLAGVVAVTLMSTLASAHEVIYDIVLSGPAEAPANASPGTGVGKVTMDLDLVTMRVEVSFSGLTGNTSASHIHAGSTASPTTTAGVATQTPSFTGFPLGVTAGSYDHTFDMLQSSSYNSAFITANGGTIGTAFNALLGYMSAGKAYLNIHTSTFGGGEIRGFLVPEPTTAVVGVAGLTLLRRRRAVVA